MRILLIGEYSGLHNSLKEGLEKNGHEVTLIGSGDGFKKYPMDIKIESTIFEFPLLKTLAKLIDKIFVINIIILFVTIFSFSFASADELKNVLNKVYELNDI